MKPLRLRFYGDPILRKVARPVKKFDGDLRALAEAMIRIMYGENGIGLAAPQVGVSARVVVAMRMKDFDDTGAPPVVMVNPKVMSTSKETWEFEEGCLSIPGVNATVIRPKAVEVEYQDLDGKVRRVKDDNVFGRIMLHEIDHLDGTLFLDYLSSAQKSLLKSRLKELREAYHSSSS